MPNKQSGLLEFGNFRLDTEQRLLFTGGQPVSLTPKAFDTLILLVAAEGRVISKEELLQKIWPDTFVEESTLSQNIFTLRKKLGNDERGSAYIETVPIEVTDGKVHIEGKVH